MSIVARSFQTVTAQAIPIYTCDNCKDRAAGSRVELAAQRSNQTPIEVLDYLVTAPISNSHLPVGWSCSGKNTHYCPYCTGKKA